MKVSMELTENPNESSRYAKQIMMETLDSTIPVILSPLRWYTGYYSLVGTGKESLPSGSFLQIISSGNQNSLFDITSIVISTDGINVKKYTSGYTVDNIHNRIIIPHVGIVTLMKNSNERSVSSLTGRINNINVGGVNFLSPVPLEVMSGVYQNPEGKKILIIEKNVEPVAPIFNIEFDFGRGEGLQRIKEYTYDPTMYLLTFFNDDKEKFVLMLGTGEGKGLACYVTGDGNPLIDTVLFTILDGE